VEAGGSAPASKEYSKSQPLRTIFLLALSTKPVLSPVLLSLITANLMCLHYINLIRFFQLRVSNFSVVFLTYCPSLLVLVAALPQPYPN